MTFGQQLGELVNANLAAGRAPQEIILVLEVTKIELVNSWLAQAGSAQAEPEKPIIIQGGS